MQGRDYPKNLKLDTPTRQKVATLAEIKAPDEQSRLLLRPQGLRRIDACRSSSGCIARRRSDHDE